MNVKVRYVDTVGGKKSERIKEAKDGTILKFARHPFQLAGAKLCSLYFFLSSFPCCRLYHAFILKFNWEGRLNNQEGSKFKATIP